MTNDQMTNDQTQPARRAIALFGHSVIRHLDLIRHSIFVIRHSNPIRHSIFVIRISAHTILIAPTTATLRDRVKVRGLVMPSPVGVAML
jgi:hypothetical protein